MSAGEDTTAFSTGGSHIEPEDLMLYALEMLSAAERGAAEEHLAGCQVCQAELAEVRADVGFYAVSSVALEEAPAGGRERLLAEAASEGRTRVSEQAPTSVQAGVSAGADAATVAAAAAEETARAEEGRRRSDRNDLNDRNERDTGEGRRGPQLVPGGQGGNRVLPWVGWAVAAALFLVAGHFHKQTKVMDEELRAKDGQIASLSGDSERAREVLSALTDPSAQRVTLTLTKTPPATQPSGRATYLPSRGTLLFIGSHLAPLPAGKTYELWLIPANGTAPRPAGTFRPDESGNASVVAPQMSEHLVAKAFGVTVEAEGGSQTPTSPILLAGS